MSGFLVNINLVYALKLVRLCPGLLARQHFLNLKVIFITLLYNVAFFFFNPGVGVTSVRTVGLLLI